MTEDKDQRIAELERENARLRKALGAVYAAPSRSNAKRIMAQVGISNAVITADMFPHSSEILDDED